MGANVWPVNAVSSSPTYQGRALRQTTVAPFLAGATAARPFGCYSGVRLNTPTTIVTATTTTWTVTPFGGVIDAEASNVAGPYAYAFDTNQTGSLTAAAGSTRLDRLDVQISDPAEDGTSTPSIAIVKTDGVAGSGVTAAAPARSHPLAVISVPSSGSPTVIWAASYSWAAGAVGYAVNAASLPATGTQGDLIKTLDTGVTWKWFDAYNASTNPTGRKTAGWKPWETSVPVSYWATGQLVNFTVGSGGTPTLTWSARGGRIMVELSVTIVSGSSWSGATAVLLPFTAADKYGTSSGPRWQLGIGSYLHPAVTAWPLIASLNAGTLDRVVPATMNAASTLLVDASAVSNTVPEATATGNTLTLNFEYDPA